MSRTVAIIQARMTSTRLPGKVLMPLAGRPMLAHVIARAAAVAGVDAVCVAAPAGAAHDPVVAAAWAAGADVVRGSEHDVLARFVQAAAETGAETVVRITSDCPMVCPAVAGAVLALHRAAGGGYARTAFDSGYPHGFDTEVVDAALLHRAAEESADPYEREHVTPFVWRRPDLFPYPMLDCRPDRRQWRLTIDEPADYALAVRIFDALYDDDPLFGLPGLDALFQARPELLQMNRDVAPTPLRRLDDR